MSPHHARGALLGAPLLLLSACTPPRESFSQAPRAELEVETEATEFPEESNFVWQDETALENEPSFTEETWETEEEMDGTESLFSFEEGEADDFQDTKAEDTPSDLDADEVDEIDRGHSTFSDFSHASSYTHGVGLIDWDDDSRSGTSYVSPYGLAENAARVADEEPTFSGVAGGFFRNCDAARAAGRAPLYRGQPGYRPALDRDRDGVACE